jgi:molecular chaperone GrpE
MTTKTKKQLMEELETLKKELEKKDKQIQEQETKLKYLQAEFDNYRKYFEKEKQNIIELANENLIKELLIIVDDFERALDSIKDEKNKQGLKLLHQNFFKILENHGLKKMEALGKKFDPYLHEAVMKEESDKENIIIEEFQKGYILKSKVIRPSKVKISVLKK